MALSPLEVIKSFSKEVKRRRIMLGMSGKELARAVNVHYTTICRWENGDFMPKIGVLPRLAEALNIDEKQLLHSRDDSEPIVKLSENVVQEIKRLRISRGITQNEFAEKVGVNLSAVARWETGVNSVASKYLPKFAEILGVSEEDLLNPSAGAEAPKKYAKARPSIPCSKDSKKEKIMT